MEVRVLEDTKTRLVVDLPGRGHTICNVLKHELRKNKNVKLTTYFIAHPLVGVPRLTVETTAAETPRKAITAALASLQKQAQGVASEAGKL